MRLSNQILSLSLAASIIFVPDISAQRNKSTAGNNHHRTTQSSSSYNSNTLKPQQKKALQPAKRTDKKPTTKKYNSQHPGYNSGKPTSPKRNPHSSHIKQYYKPHKPHGGYWRTPPANPYRWNRPLPPAPPRPAHFIVGVPTIDSILGIAFGALVDTSINALISAGYNVCGYANNTIYVSSVNLFGYTWPEAQIFYPNRRCSGGMLQYWSSRADQARFQGLLQYLSNIYGAPVSSASSNGTLSYSWWGGNNTGYITLQFNSYGNNYYTNLFFGN